METRNSKRKGEQISSPSRKRGKRVCDTNSDKTPVKTTVSIWTKFRLESI